MDKQLKVIISGGGTGGHIFPAVSIANAIKKLYPDADILFVGALGRMEMEKVPAAGYPIIGLPVRGFNRKNIFKNISVLFDLAKSMIKARQTIKTFKPDIVVGVGGYASGPTLRVANSLNIPTVIQEQNSYAGVTNKLLAKNASKICVAYPKMEKFFPSDRIIETGNPIRQDLQDDHASLDEAHKYFSLVKDKKTILIIGGSLGALTINKSIESGLEKFDKNNIQIIWQTGKSYSETDKIIEGVMFRSPFITRMDLAYKAADLVISRAGASSISELCCLGKSSILVPSPNVAEDHQTKNALALSENGAAIMVTDKDAPELLVDTAITVVNDKEKLISLGNKAKEMAYYNAADTIAKIVMDIAKK